MEKKTMPCFCTALFGILIIVFAWWKISWAPIALTVLGALVILKGLINKCCCSDLACKPKEGEESSSCCK
jgi:hypothetical protein